VNPGGNGAICAVATIPAMGPKLALINAGASQVFGSVNYEMVIDRPYVASIFGAGMNYTCNAAGIGGGRLRLVLRRLRLLILRLRTMVAFAMLARLLVVALISLVVARLMITRLMIARAVAVAREGRRWRLWDKPRLLAEIREILAVVLAVVAAAVADRLVAARLLVLPELFLSRRDQAKIMLGMLVVVLGRNGVSGGARVACELEIFFSNMRSRAADLDVGSVGLVDPGHRVLAAPVIIVVIVIIIIVAVAHPLLVLTVSHVLPLIPALKVARITDCRE